MKPEQLRQLIIAGLHNRPSLVYSGALAEITNTIQRAVETVSGDTKPGEDRSLLELAASAYGFDSIDDQKPFVFANGVAYIPVFGLLVNRFNWCYSFLTGYQFIRNQYDMAMDDPDVKGVVMDFNTCGGMVYGNFETARHIMSRRTEKPVIGVVDAMCFSGGMSLASACSSIVVTPSGDVGSIGVVVMHADYSQLLEREGVKISFIYAGDHKIDGNPYEPLPKNVRARIQKGVDKSRQEFAELVAEGRGLTVQAVLETEAGIFDTDEALEIGLIDAVATPQEALSAFISELSGSTTAQWRQPKMSTTTKAATGATETAEQKAARELQEAAANTAAIQAEEEASKKAAVTPPAAPSPAPAASADAGAAERQRIKTITTCDEATGRGKLANHIAYNTNMSAEDAKAMLAASAKEVAADTGFNQAMNTNGGPGVKTGAAGAEEGGEKQELVGTDRLMAAHYAATGQRPPKKQ